ncbi:DUF4913 domain-containing protein (plasmid) [Streptosporangium sp. CA-135522]|uniref:DUF4913 domain-containing protein n=1 Tax=Streptosporangium sp. CA-135522 TaxID=3240072 RepID=UPI003D910B67
MNDMSPNGQEPAGHDARPSAGPASPQPDLAELRSQLLELEAIVTQQARQLYALAAAPTTPADQGQAETAGPTAQQESPPDQPPSAAGPTFLLLLDDEQLFLEMKALAGWVHNVLVPVYLSEPTPTSPWCPIWWEHPVAVAWLHALWLAWQKETDPEGGAWTGPINWHTHCLTPTLAVLRAPDGPLIDCTTDPSRPQHRRPDPYTAQGELELLAKLADNDGDPLAAERLAALLFTHGDADELWRRAKRGDHSALAWVDFLPSLQEPLSEASRHLRRYGLPH